MITRPYFFPHIEKLIRRVMFAISKHRRGANKSFFCDSHFHLCYPCTLLRYLVKFRSRPNFLLTKTVQGVYTSLWNRSVSSRPKTTFVPRDFHPSREWAANRWEAMRDAHNRVRAKLPSPNAVIQQMGSGVEAEARDLTSFRTLETKPNRG